MQGRHYVPQKFHRGYAVELDYFNIQLDAELFTAMMSKLKNQESITAETFGYALGRAKAVFKRVTCPVCDKFIKEGTEKKISYAEMGPSRPVHDRCFEKVKRQENANNFVSEAKASKIADETKADIGTEVFADMLKPATGQGLANK